jgi:hypothetical protein
MISLKVGHSDFEIGLLKQIIIKQNGEVGMRADSPPVGPAGLAAFVDAVFVRFLKNLGWSLAVSVIFRTIGAIILEVFYGRYRNPDQYAKVAMGSLYGGFPSICRLLLL